MTGDSQQDEDYRALYLRRQRQDAYQQQDAEILNKRESALRQASLTRNRALHLAQTALNAELKQIDEYRRKFNDPDS